MPSPSEVEAFRRILEGLAESAGDRAAALAVADAPPEAYVALIDPYIAASSQVTAEWYHSLDPDKPFAVEPAPPPERSALAANYGWAVTQLDPAEALSGSANRQVYNTSRATVAHNARRENVRYARQALFNACAWCQMLATRGAVYHTEATAMASGHDDCNCVAVPDRAGSPYVEPDSVKQWLRDYNKAARAESGTDDIVNHMRRTDYARNKDAINAKARARYRARKEASGN